MNREQSTFRGSASRPLSRLAVIAAAVAVASALTAVISSFGAKWEWWHFSTGFTMLRVAAYGGISAGILSLGAMFVTRPGARRRGLLFAISALIIGLTTFIVLWQVQRLAQRVPPIHDITTDTQNPPEFVAVVPLRADAPNTIEHGGGAVAEQQREAYPDIQPLELDAPPTVAFRAALETARSLGWEIVAADSSAGRIEATDETFWYGFLDDVVIRLTPENGGTVLNVRSVSRVGRGDLGVNARRVRRFLARVESRMGDQP